MNQRITELLQIQTQKYKELIEINSELIPLILKYKKREDYENENTQKIL